MSPIKIVMVAAGLLAVTAPSAMADGFRYTGSPKFGQFREQSELGSIRDWSTGQIASGCTCAAS